MKEYARLLSDINTPVQQKKIAPIEVNKSCQYKNFHHQYYFEPHFLQCSQSLSYKHGSLQQSFNTQLNYSAIANVFSDSLQTQAVLEVLPKVEQPTIVEQLMNKSSSLESFLINTRAQMKILSPHSIMTVMYNKRGKIFASSFVQKVKKFFFGCEGVYIKDHDRLMSAVAAGYEDDKTQVVVQINDQQSGCVGVLHQITSMLKAAIKLNMRYINNTLLYEIFTGYQQQFDRGYVAVNANNTGIIQADMRYLISHNSVLQLVVTCNSRTGEVTSGFSYTF